MNVRPRAYPAAHRVKARARYLELQSRGRKIHTPHFVLCVLVSPGPKDAPKDGAVNEQSPRLGVTVTKKIGTAVARNRVKRVVREVFRCNRSCFPAGSDVVVIAKHGAPQLSRADAEAEILGALSSRRRG